VDFCVSTVLGFTAVQEAITVIQRSNISLCTSLSACVLAVETSSSAVAKRPRDASCLSVVSFNSTLRQVQSSIISYTLALDLPLRKLNYVLFSSAYSLVRGFLCRKQTCTVSVMQHWRDRRPSVDSTSSSSHHP